MIRRFICSALLLSAASLQAQAQSITYVRGQTVPDSHGNAVSDGDTLRVQPNDGSAQLKIRTIGIDAPEQHLPVPGQGMVGQEPWGHQSTDYLTSILPSYTDVIVEVHGKDRYRRTLGRIYLASDYTDINYTMVRMGWAIPYIYCTGAECQPGYLERENVQAYFQACDQARAEGLGIFSPSNPLNEMPFEFRLRMQRRDADKYVGDFNTRQLFVPAEYSRVDVCRRVFIDTVEHAEALGFSAR